MATFTETSVLTTGAKCVNGLTPFQVTWTYTDAKYSTLLANDVINIFKFPLKAELVAPLGFTVAASGDLDTNGSPTWAFDLNIGDDIDGASVTALIANSTAGRTAADVDALDSTTVQYRDVGDKYLQMKVDALPATAGEGAKLVFRGFFINSENGSQA